MSFFTLLRTVSYRFEMTHLSQKIKCPCRLENFYCHTFIVFYISNADSKGISDLKSFFI